MLRPLLIGLVVVNGALLAARLGGADRWLAGSDAREHEPERLQRQVNPAALRVLPAGANASRQPLAAPAAAAASAATPASAAASALLQGDLGGRQPDAAGAAMAQARAQGASPDRMCLEAGPFDAAALAAAKRVLREAGLPETSWQAASAPAAPRHVILMGRYADADHLQRKTSELRRRGVAFDEVHQSPDIPARHLPGLVLGRYAEARAAEAALAALRARGVPSARLVSLNASAPGMLLRVADNGSGALKARTAALTLPGRQAWRPCSAAHSAATAASGVAQPAPSASRA